MKVTFRRMLSLAAAGAMMLSAMPVLTASAKDVSKMTPIEIAADMGVGWNLGNTFDSHDGTNHKSLGLGAETYWGNPKTTKALIDAVKAKGFSTIRVPVTWYPHADANFNIDTAWMDRVKEVVDWCIDENTYVILNIHHEEWNKPTDANYAAASKELKAFWKQIATEFSGYDRHLIFEGMNEPRNYGGAHEWDGGTAEMREVVNKLNKDFVDTVRATGGRNSTRCLMLPTYAASNSSAAMKALTLPDDPNLMVSVHSYSPYNFALNAKGTATFSSSQQSEMKNVFSAINNTFLQNGHAVVIGEFGATNKENGDERVKWAEAFAKEAKTLGLPIVLWDNGIKSSATHAEAFGAINRKTCEWYDASLPMVNKLIETYRSTSSNVVPVAGERETIYTGTLSAEGWTPSDAVRFDLSKMTSGSSIAVTYDTNGVAPTLIIQDDDPWKVWAKAEPYSLMPGVAYYSYSDIAAAYAEAYRSAYGKDPAKPLDNAFQLFISAENNGTAGASKIEFVPAQSAKTKVDISDCCVSLSEKSYTYDGTQHKPAVTVTYLDRMLHEGTDYTVSYKGGTEIGIGSVTVVGIGEYTGSTSVTFAVDPADISGYKLGDVNFDGKINVTDVTLTAAHVKGISSLSAKRLKAADVNEDGKVNVSDITRIAAHVKGIRALADKNIAG